MTALRNSTLHRSSFFSPLSYLSSDLWTPPTPTAPPLVLPQPLPAIIVALCLFLVFGGCVTFLAVCHCPGRVGVRGSSCGPARGLHCGEASPSEPQLLLWKRLGSTRGSFLPSAVGSFRRPPRPLALAQQHPLESKMELQPPQDKRSPTEQLSIACLLQYATEI